MTGARTVQPSLEYANTELGLTRAKRFRRRRLPAGAIALLRTPHVTRVTNGRGHAAAIDAIRTNLAINEGLARITDLPRLAAYLRQQVAFQFLLAVGMRLAGFSECAVTPHAHRVLANSEDVGGYLRDATRRAYVLTHATVRACKAFPRD